MDINTKKLVDLINVICGKSPDKPSACGGIMPSSCAATSTAPPTATSTTKQTDEKVQTKIGNDIPKNNLKQPLSPYRELDDVLSTMLSRMLLLSSLTITDKLLTKNRYSRPHDPEKKRIKKLTSVKGVVIHYVGNPGTTAQKNRDYFESLKTGTILDENGDPIYASAHYIIDSKEIIRCIPDDEMAYHVGAESYETAALKRLSSYPNDCTLGIECTHIDLSGKMKDETYSILCVLCSSLLHKYALKETDLWLHYEITGKDCHKWFVDNPDEWTRFKNLVGSMLKLCG